MKVPLILLLTCWVILLAVVFVVVLGRQQIDVKQQATLDELKQAKEDAVARADQLREDLRALQWKRHPVPEGESLLDYAVELVPSLADAQFASGAYGRSLEGVDAESRAMVWLSVTPDQKWRSIAIVIPHDAFPPPEPSRWDVLAEDVGDVLMARFWIGETFFPMILFIFVLLGGGALVLRPARAWLALISGVTAAAYGLTWYGQPDTERDYLTNLGRLISDPQGIYTALMVMMTLCLVLFSFILKPAASQAAGGTADAA